MKVKNVFDSYKTDRTLSYEEFTAEGWVFNNFFFWFWEEDPYLTKKYDSTKFKKENPAFNQKRKRRKKGLDEFSKENPEVFTVLTDISRKLKEKLSDIKAGTSEVESLNYYEEYEPVFNQLFQAYVILKESHGFTHEELFR
jgi:hypothetical protein